MLPMWTTQWLSPTLRTVAIRTCSVWTLTAPYGGAVARVNQGSTTEARGAVNSHGEGLVTLEDVVQGMVIVVSTAVADALERKEAQRWWIHILARLRLGPTRHVVHSQGRSRKTWLNCKDDGASRSLDRCRNLFHLGDIAFSCVSSQLSLCVQSVSMSVGSAPLERPAVSRFLTCVVRASAPMLLSSLHTERRFAELLTTHFRNPDTRLGYLTAARRFAGWCERRGLTLDQVELWSLSTVLSGELPR